MKAVNYLRKITSVILSLTLLASTLFTGASIVSAESTYDTSIAMSKIALVGGHITTQRYDGRVLNIVNDGTGDNTDVGLWSYDVTDKSNISYAEVTAEITRYSNAHIDGLSVDFYYLNPDSVSTYLRDVNASSKITNLDSFMTNAGDNSIEFIKNLFSLSEKNLIGSLEHNYSTSSNTKFTLDLTTAFHEMTVNNWSGVCILAMQSKNNNGSSTQKWSDTWVKLGNINCLRGSKGIDYNKSAILSGGEGNARYSGNTFNIVNDGTSSCTSVGLWNYDLSEVKHLNSALLNFFVERYHMSPINDLSIDFYYINPSSASSYLKELSESNKTATDSDFTQNMGNNSITWIKNRFGLNDTNKLGSLKHDYSSSPSRYISLDLTNAINTAKDQNWDGICILAMCNKNNNGSVNFNWSDTWLNADKIYCEEAEKYIPFEKTGLLCGWCVSNRNDANRFNIANDGSADNTTVGLWSYNVSDIPVSSNASIMATSSQWYMEKIDNFGIEFYLIDSSKVSSYLKNLSATSKVSQYMPIVYNEGDKSVSSIKSNLELNDSNKVGYLTHDYTNNQNRYYTINITSVLESLKQRNIENVTLVALCNKNNNGSTTNLWSDVWLEMSGITYGANIDPAGMQNIKSAMTVYENMLASGQIYKNMGTAYIAYVNAQKALDAYVYGNMTSINMTQYANALYSAIESMTQYSTPCPDLSPRFSTSDNGIIPINTGCLWYKFENDPLVTSYSAEGCNTTTNIYYHNGVYLYTDTTPNIPFTVGFYRSSSSITANPKNPKVLYCSLRSQNGGLYIKNSQYTGDINARNFSEIISKNYRINATELSNSNNIILSSADMRYMANYFNIDYQQAFSSGNYYVEAKATAFSEGLGDKDSGDVTRYTKYIEGFTPKTFYVINYKPLIEMINSSSYRNLIRNVSSYKQGGLQSLMSAYDTATAIDPASYDYSSNTQSKVSLCAEEIQNAVNKFASVTSTAKDNPEYSTLRKAINSAYNLGNQNPIISSGSTQTTRYTQNSWNTYSNALGEAQRAFANVLSASGYANTYNSKTILAIAGQLNQTRDELKYNYIVEFISASNQNMGSMIAAEGESVDTSQIVNTATIKGVQERQSHIVYSWTPVTANREEHSDTEVITLNETESEENCELVMGDIITEPTCSTPGLRHSSCSVCNAQYVTEIEMLEHNYTSEIIPSTCHSEGYTLYTCTQCGDTYKDNYTPMTEHTYAEVTVAPTCTERGYTAQRCTVCGNEVIDTDSYTEALGHEYTATVIREADCTFNGVIEYKCIRHDSSYTEQTDIDANHHPELVYARTVAPTETESGYDIYYCNNLCGYWEKRNIVPPTGKNNDFSDYLDAYNTALETIIEDLTPYTPETKPIYTQLIADAKAQAETAIIQQDTQLLDAATRAIIEASASLRIRTVSINLYVCDVNGEIVSPASGVSLASYGDTVNLDITDSANNLSVEKWTVEQNGKTTKINNPSTNCDINAYGDAVVVAYLSEEETVSTQKTIKLQDKNGKVIATKYVDSLGDIDLTSDTLFGVTAPKVPFYTFEKWEIVSNDDNGIILKATYKTTVKEG